MLSADAEPEAIARALREAVAGVPSPGGTRRPARRAPGARRASGAGGAARRTGSVVAVWGPTGAPGRTTAAVGIADEAARLGASTLLVDADVYGGVIAQVLGLLDESPGLAGRRGWPGGRSTAAPGGRVVGPPHLPVLTGLARATGGRSPRPRAVAAVLDEARRPTTWPW